MMVDTDPIPAVSPLPLPVSRGKMFFVGKQRSARHRHQLAVGELVFHVFIAIAHFERRLIAERTRDELAAARARGKRPGRHPLDPEKIAAALELVKAGLSPTVAARQARTGIPP